MTKKDMDRQIIEPLKTFIIVLLLACTLFLAGKTGVFNELLRSVPAIVKAEEWIKMRGHTQDIYAAGNRGDIELHAAARPVSIVMTDSDGIHYGAGYGDPALEMLYNKLTKTFGEALGSASVPEQVTRRQWNDSLTGEGIYIDFRNEIPLSVIAQWLGLKMINENHHPVRRICIAEDKNGADIYYTDEDTKFFRCRTAAVLGGITVPDESLIQREVKFAIEMDEAYAGIDPYTIVYENPPDKFKIKSDNLIDDESVRDYIISVFGINPNSNARYEIEEGIVYVENRGILEIYTDGRIYYRPDEDNDSFKLSYMGQSTETGVIIEEARKLISLLKRGNAGDEEIYYSGISEKSDSVIEVTFDYFINGVEIILDGHAATVTIEKGRISEVSAYIKCYKFTGEKVAMLPERQAAASARQLSVGSELCLIYSDNGKELLDPEWVCG